jgi:hypothetical protein
MTHGKYMENLNKLDKLLRQFPHGARAEELAKRMGICRTRIYDYLDSLEVRGRARNEHSLWYPNDANQSDTRQHESTAETDFLDEKRLIREDFVNGQLDRAYARTMVLVNAGKVSEEWLERNGDLFKSLEEELQAIAKNSIEEFNPDRRKRIRRLKAAIVSEALKCWG